MVSISKKSGLPSYKDALGLSLALNVVLVVTLMVVWTFSTVPPSALASTPGSRLRSTNLQWNGGHPADNQSGTCYCSHVDDYCMCTPSLAIDLVILSGADHVWLVRRKDTSQLATMGGFVMVGETVEQAVVRELKEETGIDLLTTNRRNPPKLFGVYSDPRRDNRRHTTSAVFAVHLDGDEHPVAADDVKDVQRIPLTDIEKYDYFADHKTILLDYRRSLLRTSAAVEDAPPPSTGDFALDIKRSICTLSVAAKA